jgi:signal peptidase II
MVRTGRLVVLLALVVATIGCDRVTKHVARVALEGAPRLSLLGDTVRLEYAENTGGFLSLGANLPPAVRTAVFTVGTGLALAAMLGAALFMRWTAWQLVGISLFMAGSASNLADRVMRGTVVDFLNVGIGPVRTGIFNVADVAVLAGMCLVLWRVSASRPQVE